VYGVVSGSVSETIGIPADNTSTSYTVLTSIAGNKSNAFSSSAASVLTFDSGQSYSQGEIYNFWREGSGSVEITGSGVTLNGLDNGSGKYFIADQYSPVSVIMESSTIGRIMGNIARPNSQSGTFVDTSGDTMTGDLIVSASIDVSGSIIQQGYAIPQSNLTNEISGSESVVNFAVVTQAEYDAGTAQSGSIYFII